MNTTKTYTFFGGSLKDDTTPEYLDAQRIAMFLAINGYTVKSGGYYGLMEAVSKGAKLVKKKSIGVTCSIFPSTKGNEYLSETIVTNSIFKRLDELYTGAEFFIFHKGGIGTLSEFYLLWDCMKIQSQKAKVFLVNDIWRKYLSVFTDEELKDFIFCKDHNEFESNYFMNI
jgi:hypothetical protein